MRAAIVLALLSACATSTVPQSEACQEILGARCDATKLCGLDNSSCLAQEHQVCPTQTGEIDSTKLDGCLTAMMSYTCGPMANPAPQYQGSAVDCLDMYPH